VPVAERRKGASGRQPSSRAMVLATPRMPPVSGTCRPARRARPPGRIPIGRLWHAEFGQTNRLFLLAEWTYSKRALFLPWVARPTSTALRTCADIFDTSCRCRSGVARCFLNELYAAGESEFAVDVGEVGLQGLW
jgi:hypothetical protein